MFGFFKKKPAQPAPPPAAAQPPSPAPVSAPPAAPPPPRPPGPALDLPLREIVDSLPPELRALVKKSPGSGATVGIPLETIRAQLRTGSVRISFAELQAWAPDGVFHPDGQFSDKPVNLPLKSILAKLPPSEFQRRSSPQSISVPEEVRPIFGAKGQILAAAAPAHSEPAAPPQPPAPRAEAPPAAVAPSAPAAPPAPRRAPAGPTITLPLADIAAAAPVELKPLLPASGEVLLPLSVVTDQLPRGQVKITLRNVCEWASSDIAVPENALDSEISLPLDKILPKLPPGAFQRRPPARTVQVPEDVKPLFGSAGQPIPAAPSATPPSVHAPVLASAPPAPPPAPPEQKISFTPPPALAEPSKPTLSTPPPGASIKPPASTSSPLPSAKLPGATPPSAPAKPPAPAPASEAITVEVSKVSEEWGEDVQRVFITFPEAVLQIPKSALADALKQGRVMFTWGELQKWVRPNIGSAGAAVFDDTPLVLPLPVLAPLFFQSSSPARAQKRVVVPETIPNLFQSQGVLPPNEAGPAPAPQDSGPPAAPALPATSELGKVLGQPQKLDWTPQEIVSAITALSGVLGAVIATADGLLVSAHLPAGMKGEAVAAFVPQLFTRVAQMSKELQLGEGEITVQVGQSLLYAAPCGRNILIALGKRGLPFPTDTLNSIARELASK